jgi:Xaa-Pro dipeptidase
MTLINTPEKQLNEHSLLNARNMAISLFDSLQQEGVIKPGIKESEINERIYQIAQEKFGIKTYWHKRIVRAGKNTVCAYKENPPDLTLEKDEIIFMDFGPVFNNIETDFARTYILGERLEYKELLGDLKEVWNQCSSLFFNTPDMNGAEMYAYMADLAASKGYELADWHCGHLLGIFPHEKRWGDEKNNYLCKDNSLPLNALSCTGEKRYWVLEVHLVNTKAGFGGFVEDLLLPGISLN